MARTIDTGDYAARRGQLTRVDPRGIIYDPELNPGRPLDLESRAGSGWEEAYYADLLHAIRADPEGWQNGCPGSCERLPDGRIRLRIGFRRYEALSYENRLREGRGEPPLPYVFVFVDGDETALMRANIAENYARRGISVLGEARLIQRLMREQGLNQTEAAACFMDPEGRPRGQSWASERLQLLRLPKALQAQLHSGELGIKAAAELLRLAPEVRAKVIQRGDLSLAAIRAATEGAKPRQRTIKELRRNLEEEVKTSPSPRMLQLAEILSGWLQGASLDDLVRALDATLPHAGELSINSSKGAP